jgi:Domain of unknown function (DUF4157)
VSKQRTHAGPRPKKKDAQRPVSKPGDRHEREAERAAEIVARGGSVSSWSFSAVPASAPEPAQRQEVVKEKTDEEKKQEMVKKTSEAALATPQGQAVKEAVLKDPLVKKAKDIVTSTPGIIATGAAAAGGVAALAAAGKELPIQPPEIPLEKISKKFEGASAQLTYEGPLNKPTFVGLTLTFKEQAPKGTKKDKPDARAAEAARVRAEREMYKPESQKAAEKKEADEWVQAWVAQQKFPGAPAGVTIPLLEPQPGEKKEEKKEEKPAQPAPASPTSAPPAHAEVDGALSTPGRPLDPSTRRAMEARFGYDFSTVRVHDDARAAASAAGIDAAAFTVGEDVVFGTGRYDPSSPAGRRLLAHELAHVVQQGAHRGGGGPVIQRRNIFESLGILLDTEEGNWSDRELQDYLTLIGSTSKIEGDYDSDNKARAIVRRWKASIRGFDLLPAQKLLLIREMLDGPTLGEDEQCILDLLELSDAWDLRAMLGPGGIALTDLESDINGDNRTRLDAFVANRFDGGRDALLAGKVEVKGAKVPVGAPRHGFDPATLDARFDSDRTADDLIALIAAMPDDDRARALRHLAGVRRPRQVEAVAKLHEQGDKTTDPAAQKDLEAQGQKRKNELKKTERVLLHFYREGVPKTEADLRAGTAPTDASRREELKAALRPPISEPGGDFVETLPNEQRTYGQKLIDKLTWWVNEAHTRLAVGHGLKEHKSKEKTRELTELEPIANVARDETLGVFGRFVGTDKDPKAHPALTAARPFKPGNFHDQFEVVQKQLDSSKPKQHAQMAKDLVLWAFQAKDWARRLNSQHNAVPEFDSKSGAPTNKVAKLQDKLATDFVGGVDDVKKDKPIVVKLNELDRAWPAAERGGEVFFQIFRGGTPEEDRRLLWEAFGTLIHEFVHTLAHKDYFTYADSFGDNSVEWNTLVEGVCSLITDIVWTGIEPRLKTDMKLRQKIEGTEDAKKKEPLTDIKRPTRYPSFNEVLRLVSLVGIDNVYAAYFLGLVDRIGGPAPTAATPAKGGTP